MKERTRAALYARVSSQAQAEEERVSLREQFSEMEKHCAENGYEISGRYQDVAPGSTRKRPAFQQMLEDGREGRYDVILCWKSDRLSRGIFPAAAIMEVVESTGIKLEAVADHLDQKTFGIFAAVGKIEIDNFRERAALGKRGAAKDGRWPVGNVPYGYTTDSDRRPVVEPAEAGFVKEVFRRYVEEGQGSSQIADWLTESGAPRRRGSTWGRWFPAQVLAMLSHPAYKGEGVYGRKRHRITESGTRVTDQDLKDWITVPFPPLVSKETWDQAQQVKKSRSRFARRNTRTTHLLQGLLVCEECGYRFSIRVQKGNVVRHGASVKRNLYRNPIRYYKCGGMIRHGLKCREHSHLRAEVIEESVWSEIVKILEHPEMVQQGLVSAVDQPDADSAASSLQRAEADLKRVAGEEDRLVRLLVTRTIDEAQFGRQRKFITERLEAAQQAVRSAMDRVRAAEMSEEIGQSITAWSEQLKAGIDSLDLAERQELLRLVLHRVTINREGRIKLVLAVPVGSLMADESRVS